MSASDDPSGGSSGPRSGSSGPRSGSSDLRPTIRMTGLEPVSDAPARPLEDPVRPRILAITSRSERPDELLLSLQVDDGNRGPSEASLEVVLTTAGTDARFWAVTMSQAAQSAPAHTDAPREALPMPGDRASRAAAVLFSLQECAHDEAVPGAFAFIGAQYFEADACWVVWIIEPRMSNHSFWIKLIVPLEPDASDRHNGARHSMSPLAWRPELHHLVHSNVPAI